MAKVFDKLSWPFLYDVLRKFGFSSSWIFLVIRNIESCWFSIFINGILTGFFQVFKCCQARDPLSPSFFLIAVVSFSRGFNFLFQSGNADYYSTSFNCIPISHLSYVDDVVIFANGGKNTLTNIMLFIRHSEVVSGQLVNVSKSNFIVSKKLGMIRVRSFSRLTSLLKKTLHFTYLGSPITKGRKKREIYKLLVNKIK
ncbi:hypothetical protein ACH5RR_029340 [Cinchona calisaya]|uniref:Reverse transcriptase domain-containing protein n=1 Tax=Cinchona calisaya TaxID=153742 RepID=A0ABD2YRC8_9GENT